MHNQDNGFVNFKYKFEECYTSKKLIVDDINTQCERAKNDFNSS